MKKLKYLLLLLFLIGIFQNAALAQCDKVSFSHDGEKIYVRNNGLAGLKEIKIIGRTRDANKPIEIGDIPDLMEHIKDGKRIPIILILDKEYDCSQVIKKSTSNQNKNNTTNTNKEQITEIEVKIEKPVIKISLVKDSTENDEIAITYSIENFDNHYLKLPDGSIHKLDKPKGEIQFLKELIEGQNILVFELLNSSENSYNPKVETSVIIIYRPKPVELTSTEKNLKNFKDNIIFIAVGIFILLLIVTVLLVTKSKKKQEVVKKPVKSNSGIVIGQKSSSQTSTQKKTQCKIGLQHLKTTGFKDFYTINLNEVFDDTVVKNVYLSRNCIIDIYDFFQEFLKSPDATCETGCFLFGCWEYENDSEGTYNITIEQILKPGKDATFEKYSFNFGLEIGIDKEMLINNLRKKTGNEWVQTAWMHSHPGLNIFLSNADLSVQEALGDKNHKNRLIAIVLDIQTENLDIVFFSAKKDGTMNNELEVQKKHSLDFLYNWAKNRVIVEDTKENYFQITGINPDNFPRSIYLPDNVIIDIDKTLIADKEGEMGGLMGKIDAQHIIISDFIPASPNINVKELIGVLLCGNNMCINDLINKYQTFNLIAFFEVERNEITFFLKSKNNFELFANPISFVEFIKWNRRQRF